RAGKTESVPWLRSTLCLAFPNRRPHADKGGRAQTSFLCHHQHDVWARLPILIRLEPILISDMRKHQQVIESGGYFDLDKFSQRYPRAASSGDFFRQIKE